MWLLIEVFLSRKSFQFFLVDVEAVLFERKFPTIDFTTVAVEHVNHFRVKLCILPDESGHEFYQESRGDPGFEAVSADVGTRSCR